MQYYAHNTVLCTPTELKNVLLKDSYLCIVFYMKGNHNSTSFTTQLKELNECDSTSQDHCAS